MKTAADMQVHLYALCWNEERMLGHFFQHYDSIVDRYFIFDNGSTDRSWEILSKHPRVTLEPIEFAGDSFVLAARQFYNQCWKASRGAADWVIVCNIDEHMIHVDLRGYLAGCTHEGFSLIVPEGYEAVSDTFPTGIEPLWSQVPTGMRWEKMDKPQLFSPNLIDEINFAGGRHSANPIGEVRTPPEKQVRLLHFKCLGLEYMTERFNELRLGLRDEDVARKWGHRYLLDDEQKREEFAKVKAASVKLSPLK